MDSKSAIRQDFLLIFTISITFPMQMDCNSSNCFSAKLPIVFIQQTFLLPNFFTIYSMHVCVCVCSVCVLLPRKIPMHGD